MNLSSISTVKRHPVMYLQMHVSGLFGGERFLANQTRERFDAVMAAHVHLQIVGDLEGFPAGQTLVPGLVRVTHQMFLHAPRQFEPFVAQRTLKFALVSVRDHVTRQIPHGRAAHVAYFRNCVTIVFSGTVRGHVTFHTSERHRFRTRRALDRFVFVALT